MMVLFVQSTHHSTGDAGAAMSPVSTGTQHPSIEAPGAMERGVRVISPAQALRRDIIALLVKIAVLIVIAALLFSTVFGLFYNLDHAMVPAFRDGDLVMFYRFDREYVAQDTLVLSYEGTRQVRRVIAVAGNTVDITNEGLYIDGALQQEPNIYFETNRYVEGVEFPLTVGENQVFVLGDNRKNSIDSRMYGPINSEDTLGTVMMVMRRRGM